MKKAIFAVCLLLITRVSISQDCYNVPDSPGPDQLVYEDDYVSGVKDWKDKTVYLIRCIFYDAPLVNGGTKIIVVKGTSQIPTPTFTDIYQVVPCYLGTRSDWDYQAYLVVGDKVLTASGQYAGIPGITGVVQAFNCPGVLSLKDKEDPRRNTTKPYTFTVTDMQTMQKRIVKGSYPQMRQQMVIGRPYIWTVGKASLAVKEMRMQ